MQRLLDRGGAIAPSEETGYTVPIDPEAYKSAALELLDAAGVRYLLHAFSEAPRVIVGDSGVVIGLSLGA